MSSYTYKIGDDFSNGLNLLVLNKDIQEQISKSFAIFPIGDKITINFFVALDETKKGLLDTIINNHDPNHQIQGKNYLNVSMATYRVSRSTYSTINTFIFPGTNQINVTNMKILSVMQEAGMSYDVRILDITNNKTIASLNLSNTEEVITDVKPISNLPTKGAIFEIQAKINGPTVAYVKNLNMYFT